MSNMVYHFRAPSKQDNDQVGWIVKYRINGVQEWPPYPVAFDQGFDLPQQGQSPASFENGRHVEARLYAVDDAGNESGTAFDFSFDVVDDQAPPAPTVGPELIGKSQV